MLFLAGTSLNGLVLATFIKHRCLLTNSNILVFNLCITNLILLVAITSVNVVANTKEHWPVGDEGCKAYGFLATLCGLSSINHLAGTAFQQYDTIDRASKGRGLLNKRRVVYVSLLIWLYSVCFSVAPLVGWSSYSLEGIGTSCCVNWSSSSPNNISFRRSSLCRLFCSSLCNYFLLLLQGIESCSRNQQLRTDCVGSIIRPCCYCTEEQD